MTSFLLAKGSGPMKFESDTFFRPADAYNFLTGLLMKPLVKWDKNVSVLDVMIFLTPYFFLWYTNMIMYVPNWKLYAKQTWFSTYGAYWKKTHYQSIVTAIYVISCFMSPSSCSFVILTFHHWLKWNHDLLCRKHNFYILW